MNVYTFDPQEEEISCCACLVTPDGLNSLSARNDLINNVLTPVMPSSIVVKFLASVPATSGTAAAPVVNVCKIRQARATYWGPSRLGRCDWNARLGYNIRAVIQPWNVRPGKRAGNISFQSNTWDPWFEHERIRGFDQHLRLYSGQCHGLWHL